MRAFLILTMAFVCGCSQSDVPELRRAPVPVMDVGNGDTYVRRFFIEDDLMYEERILFATPAECVTFMDKTKATVSENVTTTEQCL